MKFTLSWLEDHLATKATLEDLLALMMKAGLEVESVVDPARALAPFTVCKVRDAAPHPQADKLRVCSVDTVDGLKQIVCGAPNARAGMTAIYAPLGTFIPGLNLALDKTPRAIRGVESHGMMCSARELETGEDHDGIIDLPDSFALGTSAAEALGKKDPVIDFEVTPNRPDWLGVRGIARDLAAAGAGRLIKNDPKKISGSYDCPVEIVLDASGACPVFAGVLIRGVTNKPSPDWMQQRLKAIGVTPRSLLVDVTNYISFDRARPLHVYDADRLQGAVTARLGQAGEKLLALDGRTYEISEDMCVIADASGPIGLGGVMGGESTAVSASTVNVFIESAWFDPMRTARTGRATGILSDARFRFERGVDPQSCMEGLALAVQLILDHGGGQVSRPKKVGLAPARIEKAAFYPRDVERLTGLIIKPAEMRRILKDLEFGIEDAGEAWYLSAPSHRFDIEQSADIVEEMARLVGYDQLPVTSLPPPLGGRRAMTTPIQSRVAISRRTLAARGFLEVVTWSFMLKAHAAEFGEVSDALTLANPIAADLNYMRPSLMGNLARAGQRALDRGERHVRFFEAGPAYLGDGPKDQRTFVSALVRPTPSRHWQNSARGYDSFAAKADVFAVLEALGQSPSRFQVAPPNLNYWHPGQAARLSLGPKLTVAHFGQLHPGVLKALDVEGPVFGFEVNLNALPINKTRSLKTKPVLERTELTPVRRDLAFIVDAKTESGDLVKAALGADKALVSDVTVFDVYRGANLPDGKVSMAIEITVQPKAALRDEDIQGLMDRIVAAVGKATGGVLRA